MTKGKVVPTLNRLSENLDQDADDYLNALIDRAGTESVKRKLRNLHAACRELVKRERMLTVPLVVKTCDQLSGELIGESTIRNKRGSDNLYNALYNKWKQVATAKAATKRPNVAALGATLLTEDRIRLIPDVHLQHHITLLFAKARSLEQQLNILKEERTDVPLRIEGIGATTIEPEISFLDGEIEALRNFVNPRSMNARALKANADGSVFLKDGRPITDPGFFSAVEKVIRRFWRSDD